MGRNWWCCIKCRWWYFNRNNVSVSNNAGLSTSGAITATGTLGLSTTANNGAIALGANASGTVVTVSANGSGTYHTIVRNINRKYFNSINISTGAIGSLNIATPNWTAKYNR